MSQSLIAWPLRGPGLTGFTSRVARVLSLDFDCVSLGAGGGLRIAVRSPFYLLFLIRDVTLSRRGLSLEESYLVDPASSHMLVSKIKPCMSKFTLSHGETANGSLNQSRFLR